MNTSFTEVVEQAPMEGLQGVGTNALVHNPFAFEDVAEQAPMEGLQGVGTNALVHNPFAFEDDRA